MRCGIVVAFAATSACALFPSLDGLTSGGGGDGSVPGDGGDASSADVSDSAATDVVAPKPTYQRTITIHNNAQVSLPAGYTIGVAFPPTDMQAAITAGKMRSDMGDLRVSGTAGERDRLIDAPPLALVVWFSLASPVAAGATDTTYALTYGVPNAPAPPANGAAVFGFYDGFDGTALDAHWLSQGTTSVGGGVLTLPQGGDGALTTLAEMPQTSMELRAQVTDPSSAPETSSGFYYWFGFQHTGDFVASQPWILWIARNPNTVGAEDQADGCTNLCASSTVPQTTAFRVYGIERQAAQTIFSLDGAPSYTTPATNDQALSLMIRNYLVTGDVVVDWIRSRPRIYPEPTVTLGSEQAL